MRGPNAALACLALLLCATVAFACGGSSGATSSDTSKTPTSTVAAIGSGGLYIALGDSLSAGIGASDIATTGFVALVHASLGPRVQLENLGVPGDTSQDLIDDGHLDRAVQEIEKRKGDSDPNNDVQLVTLEVGGNDLLDIYFSLVQTGDCPDVDTSLQNKKCRDALSSAFDAFRPNLTKMLDRLRAADPSLRILLLTLYNPFSHLPRLSELGDLSLEGKAGTAFPGGLNDIIRDVAQPRNDVTVVDVYPLFQGKTQEIIAGDHIHPNDAGYKIMADAVIAALAK